MVDEPVGLEVASQQGDADRMRLDVVTTKAGIKIKPTFKNACIYLGSGDDNITNLFRYNLFHSRAELIRRPPWGQLGDYPKLVEDSDTLALKAYFVETYGMECPKGMLDEAIDYVAHYNQYDPMVDYLNSIKWDGVPRVKSWLFDYMAVEPSDYAEFVGRMTLVAACARIFKPGIKYDYMMILEGDQGIGKSMAIKALGGEHYREISMSERDKETVEKMQGAWLIEVAEMAVFRKRDIENLKAFITCAEDVQRLSYGKRSKSFPRRSIFIGTINPDNNGYLTDSTGNRRFLPVLCEGRIKFNELAAIRDQLWAEALVLYKDGSPLFIPHDSKVAEDSLSRQANRQSIDEWEMPISDWLERNPADRLRGIDIWTSCFKGYASDFDRPKQIRVANCMLRLGWQKGVYRFEGKQHNGYAYMGIPVDPDKELDPWEDAEE